MCWNKRFIINIIILKSLMFSLCAILFEAWKFCQCIRQLCCFLYDSFIYVYSVNVSGYVPMFMLSHEVKFFRWNNKCILHINPYNYAHIYIYILRYTQIIKRISQYIVKSGLRNSLWRNRSQSLTISYHYITC